MILDKFLKSFSPRRRDAWLFIAIVSLILTAFISDLNLPLGIAAGVFFVVPVALTLLFRQPVFTWTVAGISAFLIILDIFLKPTSGVPSYFVIFNRAYAFIAVGIVVGIGYLQRRLLKQSERLAALSVMEERERLSRELHDDLSQLLGSIGARASAVSELLVQNRAGEAQHEMAQLRDDIGHAYLNVRQYIIGLRVQPLGDHRFLQTLEDFAKYLAGQAGLQLSLDVQDSAHSFRLAPNVEIQAIRIVQEAMTNTLRHSNARNLQIRVSLNANKLQITIQDDGQGFEFASVDQKSHLGLQMMRERAELVKGSLTVTSSPGQGTSVTLILPCEVIKSDGN